MSQPLLTESSEKTKQRIARREPHPASPRSFQGGTDPFLHLQRVLGNQRVAQLIKAKRLTPEGRIIGGRIPELQSKLTVGAADDQYEQEADRVARQVVAMPDPVATDSLQQAHHIEGEAGQAQSRTLQSRPLPLASSITPFVQRQMGDEEQIEEEKDQEEDKEGLLQGKFLNKSVALPLQRQPVIEEKDPESIQAKRLVQREVLAEEDRDKIQTKCSTAAITPVLQPQIENNEEPKDEETAVQAKSLIQRSASQEEENQEIQTKPLALPAASFMQRQAENYENAENSDATIQAKLTNETYGRQLQRQSAIEEEAEPIQAKPPISLSDSFEAGEDVESQLSRSKGQGSPLPDHVRSYMEPRFGVDFSHVRIHTGSNAIQMNRDVGAQAFAHGSDIYYGGGSSPTNLELTAHELAHVIQQTGGMPLQMKGLRPSRLGRLNKMLDRKSVPKQDVISLEEGAVLTVHPEVEAGIQSPGGDIWIGSGGSVNDRQLMAHELTQVVQQSGNRNRSPAGQAVVQRQESGQGVASEVADDSAGGDSAVEQVRAAEDALRPAIERVLTEASRIENYDLPSQLPAAVAEVLTASPADAQARANTSAHRVAEMEEQVAIPPYGDVAYDLALVVMELDTLHRQASFGLEGVTVSAGLRHVIRTSAQHSAQAIAAVLPGTASFAVLYEMAVRADIAAAATAIHDATTLLRLELEGTMNELVELRRAFALAIGEEARRSAGAAIGQTSRRALLLNDALARAAGSAGATGATALDTAVQARAADISRLRQTAEAEDATRQELGNRLELLALQQVTIEHGATDDNPVSPMGDISQEVVQPEQAFPRIIDEAERTMAGELSQRVSQQRAEMARLHGQVVPASPAYTLEEFARVHRRWFSMYSLAQEQQDPTVQLMLELMGEPYQMAGTDTGSALVSVEGGIARAFLMQMAVDMMSGSLHGETTQFGGQLRGPARDVSTTGTADEARFRYGEVYPTQNRYEPGREGEVGSRGDYRARRSQDTAMAATVVAAMPAHAQMEQARRSGLVTGPGDVPLVGVRPVVATEGWTYLTDVYAGPEPVLVAREQKTVPPEVAEYLLAARQQRAALSSAHRPMAGRQPIGSGPMRSGGVEAATGTSEARYLGGEEHPRQSSEVSSLSIQLAAAQRETGVRPGSHAADAEQIAAELQGELRRYLDAFFAERQSMEYRLAAIFALANTEHQIGEQIQALLDPANLAMMIGEAVKISAIVMTLQALGPLGEIAAHAYQAHLQSQGVSNVAALISVAAFCRNAADADSLNRARAWGYMSRNIVEDASSLFENLVTMPVTHALHGLTQSRPASPRELADAVHPLMNDPAARETMLREVNESIARLEGNDSDRSSSDLISLRAFRDSLEGVSRTESAHATETDLPGRTDQTTDPAALFTGPRRRSATDLAAIRATLTGDLAAVLIVESRTVTGNEVRVRYGDDGGVRVEIGPDAGPEHVRRHAETVRELRRFEGIMGGIRRLLSRIRQAIIGHPAYGTQGFEARLEVQKLNRIIGDLEAQLRSVESHSDRLTSRDGVDLSREGESIRRDIEALQRQLSRHEAEVDSYESGRGFIAAEDTTPEMDLARDRARALRERATAAAPGVRSALERAITAQGGNMAGLEFEIKSEDSLARKIHDRAAERGPVTDTSLDAAAARINDTLRYTAVVESGNYMAAHDATRAALVAAGYTFLREGNAWAEPERFGGTFRGINMTFRTAEGLEFEVQFHTRESLAMKEELHPSYDERRRAETSPERKHELAEEERRRWREVPVPPGSDVRPPRRQRGRRE